MELRTGPVYILGYSGLANAIEFRRDRFPAFSEEEIRICQGWDSAAALLVDGRVVAAAAEERFNGETHSHKFPLNAMKCCLREAGIGIDDLTAITHGFNYALYEKFFTHDAFGRTRYEAVFSPGAQKLLLAEHFPASDIEHKFVPVQHHQAHAASAYYPSGVNNALIVVIDAMGEVHSISVFAGVGNEIRTLKQYDFFSSVGMFYSLITHHLGFSVKADEYKVMGLAPYGDPRPYEKFMEECIHLRDNGEVYIPVYLKNRTMVEKETYKGLRDWLDGALFPARLPEQPLEQKHNDLAASLQRRLEQAVLHVVKFWQGETSAKNLCLAGGVALNCVANQRIMEIARFDDIYVQPASADDGTAIGSALHHYFAVAPTAQRTREALPLYGPRSSDAETARVLERWADALEVFELPEQTLLSTVADMLVAGRVVAWMQGRMEFGPRALGNRSILADPRLPEMREIVNRLVKKREAFRPFAPSVKEDKAHIYFDIPEGMSFPHMLFTVPVRAAFRDMLPSITHVDGSARIQTVSREAHPLYWKLLDAFEQESGVPILLNTSFNVKGQPIVRSADDAVATFLSTNLDALVIGTRIIRRTNTMADAHAAP